MKCWTKYIALAAILLVPLSINGINNDSIPATLHNGSVDTPLINSYSAAYEAALRRKEELISRKTQLIDSIKYLNKEYKRLGELHASIVKSNNKLENKNIQVKKEMQKNGILDLIKKKELLIDTIVAEEKEKALLDLQLKDIETKLEPRNREKESLERTRDSVSGIIIAENKEYLEKPFSQMSHLELQAIKSKCDSFMVDPHINSFVKQVDVVIKNKRVCDNMTKVVNAAYNKNEIDKALISVNHIKAPNSIQQKEISELKDQLMLFSEGLDAFKEFITKLNRMRDGVNYSWEFFQTDCKQIMSKNNLGERVENHLKRVPYLNQKYEEYLAALKSDPNSHPAIELEILNQ